VKACYEVLKGQGVGMSEPLVDDEGISSFSPQQFVKFMDTLISPASSRRSFFTVFRIRIQEGKNDPQEKKKLKNVMFWCAACVLEGFSVASFISFFVIKTLNPDPE
jgi:hypothetical protein